MKDCFYQYRKGLYETLTANITYDGAAVPVMEFAAQDQATPYIHILAMNSSLVMDHDNFSQQLSVNIGVVTSHVGEPSDFGSKQSDDIMNDVMELLITMGVTVVGRGKHITMDDFVDSGCFFENLSYENYYDGKEIIIVKTLTITTMIDENFYEYLYDDDGHAMTDDLLNLIIID